LAIVSQLGSLSMDGRQFPKLVVRLPPDVKSWVAIQAALNESSQTSEVVRAIRERMERLQAHGRE
jgi:hypothetical protein